MDIDVQGVKAVKASSLSPKYVFIAPPSLEVTITVQFKEISMKIEKNEPYRFD